MGESIDFAPDGTIVQSCNYRANLLNGPVRRYWPNGELMEEVMYRDGKPQGAPARYDARGHRTDNAEATPAILERLQKLVRGS
jgi:antitoxin component YwqK of YwqJK toxin-antitoxin module